MCKQSSNLHFCTCNDKNTPIIHNQNSRRFKRMDEKQFLEMNIIWTLERSTGKKEEEWIEMGSMAMPTGKLTDEITEEYVLRQLNTRNPFDFEYQPLDGDCLQIRFNYKNKKIRQQYKNLQYRYLSFIFRKDKWTPDVNIPFGENFETIFEGKIRIMELED